MDTTEQIILAINYRYNWYKSQGLEPDPWPKLEESRKQYWIDRANNEHGAHQG